MRLAVARGVDRLLHGQPFLQHHGYRTSKSPQAIAALLPRTGLRGSAGSISSSTAVRCGPLCKADRRQLRLLLSGGNEALEFLEPVQHKVDLRGGLLRLDGLDHQESLAILADIVA
jgi:hypothetical protein